MEVQQSETESASTEAEQLQVPLAMDEGGLRGNALDEKKPQQVLPNPRLSESRDEAQESRLLSPRSLASLSLLALLDFALEKQSESVFNSYDIKHIINSFVGALSCSVRCSGQRSAKAVISTEATHLHPPHQICARLSELKVIAVWVLYESRTSTKYSVVISVSLASFSTKTITCV